MIEIPDDLELSDPNALPFGEIFAIKAATGIDVLEQDATTQTIALAWYALKQRGAGVEFKDMLQVTPAQLGPAWERLKARIGAEAAAAELQRNQTAEQAAVLEQAELMGDATPDVEPASDPT